MVSLAKWKQILSAVFVEGKARKLTGWKLKLFISIGFLMSVYQVWSVSFAKIDPIKQMSIHLSFILVLTFFLFTFSKNIRDHRALASIDFLLVILAASSGIYYVLHAERIATRAVGVDVLTNWDIVFGLIFVVLSIEAARRTIGIAITFVALAFIAYALFGHLLNGVWYHYEMSRVEVLDQLAFSFNGLWGSPISVAASFVFIFILFGSFLQKSGAGEFFFDLSVSLAGRTRGGAAKIAIIASAFFGTISGSPTANVVTTGAFTIPMAKKVGYSPRFAAAIEAIASTGGSLLPPIMGSSAFLMAALTGIPYTTIVLAALLPGILFYLSLFSLVHFEAVRKQLPRADLAELPKLSHVLKAGWFHFIPLLVLVTFLLKGNSPSRTGMYAIISIVIVSLFRKTGRMGIKKIIQSMADGAKAAIPVSTACAAAGLVITGIMSTGLGGKLTSIILSVTAGKLLASLLLIMIMCLILGMGMPVAAAYILTAMLAAPALITMGVSVLSAHLFIVYFSILSAITPPVAVAAFAAAGIAQTNPNRVGFEAIRLGSASFIIPFIFVYQPALLMDGPLYKIIYTMLLSSGGMIVIGAGVIGFFYKKISLITRLLIIATGLMMVYPAAIVNMIGLGLVTGLFFVQKRQEKPAKDKADYIVS